MARFSLVGNKVCHGSPRNSGGTGAEGGEGYDTGNLRARGGVREKNKILACFHE